MRNTSGTNGENAFRTVQVTRETGNWGTVFWGEERDLTAPVTVLNLRNDSTISSYNIVFFVVLSGTDL